MSMKQLGQRVAVVTGAGSGIGRATALLLAAKGCRLALADVNVEGLEETARLARERGAVASTQRVDVSDRTQVEAFAAEVVHTHGAVHVLINNAGVAVNAKFVDHSLEDFEWLMGVNFWGVVYGCKFFLPHLLKADEGHIVNISSLFGLVGVPQQSSYCASKFAVRGFTESLRSELIGSRVGVTTVHPGGIATNIAAASRVSGDDRVQASHQRAVKMFRKMMPPEQAAEQIVRGITAKRARVLITRESHLLDLAKRLAPTASNRIIDWGFKRLQ
jgi:NAD(P)-dependent dehydrogenase (short-subunit alcohol dehydrogenase family)